MKFLNSVIILSVLVKVSPNRIISYKELKTLRAECYPFDTCNTTKENINNSVRSCNCDNLCAQYGDCCLDAEKRQQMERTRIRNHTCLKIRDSNGYFVYSTCKIGWRDPIVKRKCEGKSVIEDPFSSLPAISKRSKVTYKNRYCASCNEDDENLGFWKIAITCSQLDSSNSTYVRDNLIYNHQRRKWGLLLPNKTFVDCELNFDLPKDRQNLRFCYPDVIYSCSSNWKDSFIRERCRSYTAVVLVKDTDKYRNVHCAICNGINLKDVSCSSSILHRKLPGSPNFVHLFDVDDPRCKPGEVWDSAFERCRKLSCGLPFLKLKNGVCVPKSE